MFQTALNSLVSADFERFVIYRAPGQSTVHLLILDDVSTEVSQDYYAVRGFNDEVESRYPILREFNFEFADFMSVVNYSVSFDFKVVDDYGVASHEQFVTMVKQAINQIEIRELDKVVMARCSFEPVQVKDLFALFKSLCSNNEVYAYVFHEQNKSTWAGASPELLLKREGNNISSMALAGTKLVNSNQDWAEKEIKEQRIVSDYIYSTFVYYNVKDVEQRGTTTLSTGKLQHICSEVTGKLTSAKNISNLIKALHPTPALGGFPKHVALNFIRTSEPFKRDWYGGYLGRVSQNDMALFVNIRCIQIGQNGVKYFAGAGINLGSNAEKEWLETENKMSVMKSLISGIKINSQS